MAVPFAGDAEVKVLAANSATEAARIQADELKKQLEASAAAAAEQVTAARAEEGEKTARKQINGDAPNRVQSPSGLRRLLPANSARNEPAEADQSHENSKSP